MFLSLRQAYYLYLYIVHAVILIVLLQITYRRVKPKGKPREAGARPLREQRRGDHQRYGYYQTRDQEPVETSMLLEWNDDGTNRT